LLIEDDLAARTATQLLLEQRGATVRSVESAMQAREAILARRPDVVIADIGMRDEDGYTFIEGLRRTERQEDLPRIPAVAVTAFARIEDRERALAAGFDDHLPKPLDPERLMRVLVQLIES